MHGKKSNHFRTLGITYTNHMDFSDSVFGARRLMIIIIGLDVKVSKLHFESTTLMDVNYVCIGNNHY